MRKHGEVMPPEEVWQVAKQTPEILRNSGVPTDCGILQMMSMNFLCEDLSFDFDETGCPRFHQQIALNLMRNRLDLARLC